MIPASTLVEKLDLQPHPEGGYFKEVYRSDELIKVEGLPERYSSERCFSTSIYYMLVGEQFSAFHKLQSDETWHFYLGSPIVLHLISSEGNYSKIILGQNITEDENLQYTIPRETWFAAEVKDKTTYSLVGCTVSPGFDFADFEMGDRKTLLDKFQQHQNLIKQFSQ
ncbi:MAG: cupin domain-containing protein [Melioribacteraceae bacterium]|nr:MAG: cupin domain-containing protein [Melioribacteraceae bacterium]